MGSKVTPDELLNMCGLLGKCENVLFRSRLRRSCRGLSITIDRRLCRVWARVKVFDSRRLCSQIKSLILTNDDYLSREMLFRGLRLIPNLCYLDLWGIDTLKAMPMRELKRALAFTPHLRDLNLGCNGLESVDILKLAGVFSILPDLERLSLSVNRLGLQGAEKLVHMFDVMPNLRYLDLQWKCVGPEEAKLLSQGLRSLSSLEHLALGYNNIGDFAAKKVIEAAISLPNFKILNLRSNALSNQAKLELMEEYRDYFDKLIL